jgi:nitrate/nitrite transport system ATP-binding protein
VIAVRDRTPVARLAAAAVPALRASREPPSVPLPVAPVRVPARPATAGLRPDLPAPGPLRDVVPVAACAPQLELRGVHKSWAGCRILAGIDLRIARGEFHAVVGFSGSGKSTLVNIVGGLVLPDAGEVLWEGAPVRGPGPERGMVFQNYSLMPWLTAFENVALAVDQVFARDDRAARRQRVERYLALVNLTPARDKRPAELSGGMRQRVALARALAMEPSMLLLDEPLSALDALTRANLQDELMRISALGRTTVLLITNDVDEAILLADRVSALLPAPAGRLGETFEVGLPRPRGRKALNRDAGFIARRKTLTEYLLALGAGRRGCASAAPPLPDVQPTTARALQAPGALHTQPPEGTAQPRFVELSRLGKAYPAPRGGSVRVVDGFDLNIARREFVSIIGHSGCGKSTVLSMLAGLTDASEGVVTLDGREIDGAGPDRAMVFQAPSLVPWLTARENVLLGVERVFPHVAKPVREAIAAHYLHRVGLGDAMDRRARELSGGMRQRVGIARAFALAPKLLLLDEPFGMLDSLTRWDLQEVLMDVWAKSRLTAVLVTHDVDEAILLGDRVVMMTQGPNARVGRVLAVDLPRPRTRQALLDHPDYYRLRAELIDFLGGADHG